MSGNDQSKHRVPKKQAGMTRPCCVGGVREWAGLGLARLKPKNLAGTTRQNTDKDRHTQRNHCPLSRKHDAEGNGERGMKVVGIMDAATKLDEC